MRRTFAFMLCTICLLAPALAASWAAEPEDAAWSAGARGAYLLVPDFILDAYYEKHTHINAATYGLFGSYSFDAFDLVFGVDNFALNYENGQWLKRDKDPDETDYVEADLGFTSADVRVLWKFPFGDYFVYRLGAGLGFGFVYGDYASYDVIDGERQPQKDDPKVPPVVPVCVLQTGVQFFFVDRFCLNVDLGFQNGLFFGGGLQYYF